MEQKNPFYSPFFDADHRYRVLYGGAGSGKSVAAAQDEVFNCARSPHHKTLLVRKVKGDIRDSSYEQVRQVMKATGLLANAKERRQEMRLTFPSPVEGEEYGSEMLGVGLDDAERLKSITGPTRVWIEEANQITEEDFNEIDRRLRGSGEVDFQITLTFNPAIPRSHWIRRRLLDGTQSADPSRIFVMRTTIQHNPWADEEYANVLASLPEKERKIYLEGQFHDSDSPDQLIKSEWVEEAFGREARPLKGRTSLGVDVARFGDDDTCIAVLSGTKRTAVLSDVSLTSGQKITQTVEQTLAFASDYDVDAELCGVDTVGMGGGVADGLDDAEYSPTEIVAGASPITDSISSESFFDFQNLRSQMWWHIRTLLKEGRLAIALDRDSDEAKRLQADLTAPKYRIRGDRKIEVEPKSGSKNWGIKNRLGRSPDVADAVIQGAFVHRMAGGSFGGALYSDRSGEREEGALDSIPDLSQQR